MLKADGKVGTMAKVMGKMGRIGRIGILGTMGKKTRAPGSELPGALS